MANENTLILGLSRDAPGGRIRVGAARGGVLPANILPETPLFNDLDGGDGAVMVTLQVGVTDGTLDYLWEDSQFQYTPDPGFEGTDSFELNVWEVTGSPPVRTLLGKSTTTITVGTGATVITVDDGIPATSVVGEPTVTVDSQISVIDGVAATSAVGEPTVIADLTITVQDGVPASSAVGEPTVTTGVTIVVQDGVPATSAVGEPVVLADQFITVQDGIAATSAVGEPVVAADVFITVQDGVPATSAVGEPVVTEFTPTPEITYVVPLSCRC